MTGAALGSALVIAAVAMAAAYRLRVRRTADERVAAAADRIAGEWASRSELAALLDPGELMEHTLAEVAALPGASTPHWPCSKRQASGAQSLSGSRRRRRSASRCRAPA